MLVYRKHKYLNWDAMTVWWPESAQVVRRFLDEASVVILWQCPESFLPELRPWIFHKRQFHTPLINLSRPQEQLWQDCDPKSCRYEIRKAQKLDCAISCNEDPEAARLLLNDSIRRLHYTTEITPTRWQGMLPQHDVFLCRHQRVPLAAHVILRDPPKRARLLMSGTVDRHDARFRNSVGPCNRLLHWHELCHYQSQGFSTYDFGGCDLDKQAAAWPISQFKLSFGGEITPEPMLYLTRKPALRSGLRLFCAARSALRAIPLPEGLIRAIKARPRLSSFLRY
jgi:hypothetical protein